MAQPHIACFGLVRNRPGPILSLIFAGTAIRTTGHRSISIVVVRAVTLKRSEGGSYVEIRDK